MLVVMFLTNVEDFVYLFHVLVYFVLHAFNLIFWYFLVIFCVLLYSFFIVLWCVNRESARLICCKDNNGLLFDFLF